jgi:hypothetical protein
MLRSPAMLQGTLVRPIRIGSAPSGSNLVAGCSIALVPGLLHSNPATTPCIPARMPLANDAGIPIPLQF